MFEFLTRRHTAPAETPLSEVRFTREDLFVLLGGCDTGMFANGEHTIDFDWLERRGTDPWRRDMAERLSPTGLVDAEGVPSDELAEALYPLNKPGMVVDDGGTPQSARERDERTVSAVLFEGSASAIRRLPGRRAGFSVVPLGPEADWDVSFRGLVGCPPLASPWEGAGGRYPAGPRGGVRHQARGRALPAGALCEVRRRRGGVLFFRGEAVIKLIRRARGARVCRRRLSRLSLRGVSRIHYSPDKFAIILGKECMCFPRGRRRAKCDAPASRPRVG